MSKNLKVNVLFFITLLAISIMLFFVSLPMIFQPFSPDPDLNSFVIFTKVMGIVGILIAIALQYSFYLDIRREKETRRQ